LRRASTRSRRQSYTIRWETGEIERDIFHAELQRVPQGRRRVVVNYAALEGGRA